MKRVPARVDILALLALGIAAVFYGGFDDSPGLQLLGVRVILGVAVQVLRSVMRKPKRP